MFHASRVLLQPGCAVLAGNYGREIARQGEQHPRWHRERILEEVRVRVFAEKPSRLRSAFVCPSIETARFYRDVHDPGAYIYEVEKVLPDAAEHRADFNVIQPLPGRPENMEEIAFLYWTARLWTTVAGHENIRCEEVLFETPIRILNQIE